MQALTEYKRKYNKIGTGEASDAGCVRPPPPTWKWETEWNAAHGSDPNDQLTEGVGFRKLDHSMPPGHQSSVSEQARPAFGMTEEDEEEERKASSLDPLAAEAAASAQKRQRVPSSDRKMATALESMGNSMRDFIRESNEAAAARNERFLDVMRMAFAQPAPAAPPAMPHHYGMPPGMPYHYGMPPMPPPQYGTPMRPRGPSRAYPAPTPGAGAHPKPSPPPPGTE